MQKNSLLKSTVIYVILTIACIAAIFPIYWMFLTSLKSVAQISSSKPLFFFTPTWSNYIRVFIEQGFSAYFFNSIIVAVSVTILSVGFGTLAAYSLSRYRFSDQLPFWILSTRMAPPVLAIIPLFILFKSLGLLNSYLGLILAHTTFNLPFAVWVMKDFLTDIPIEIDRAALVDGLTRLQAFRKVVLPLCWGGIISTAVFCFIFSWNEFIFALVLSGSNTKTLPLAAAGFITPVGIDWGGAAAVGAVAILPAAILAVILQKYLVRGLTMGAVRG